MKALYIWNTLSAVVPHYQYTVLHGIKLESSEKDAERTSGFWIMEVRF